MKRAPREAFNSAREGRVEELVSFLEADGDVNEQDSNGMTRLHHAVAAGARPYIRALVNSGKCDYLIQDDAGRYASDIATEWSRDYAVARLLTKHQVRQAHERGVPPVVRPWTMQMGRVGLL
jgi:ankyrin repeat protein